MSVEQERAAAGLSSGVFTASREYTEQTELDGAGDLRVTAGATQGGLGVNNTLQQSATREVVVELATSATQCGLSPSAAAIQPLLPSCSLRPEVCPLLASSLST